MPQNPYLFKGGIQDRTTGWVHYGARWYNPGTGRWTQQDTLDNPLDPANANRYAYAGDDPTNNNDPAGLKCAAGADAAAKIIGGIGIAATLTTLVAAGLASAPETGGVSVAATVAGISSVIGASGDITGGLLTLLC